MTVLSYSNPSIISDVRYFNSKHHNSVRSIQLIQILENCEVTKIGREIGIDELFDTRLAPKRLVI